MVDDVLAEGFTGDRAGGEQVARLAQGRGHARLVRDVRVALVGGLERELGVDAVQAGGDHRREGEVGVDVRAGHAVLDAQRRPVADHAHRARAVVDAPRDRCRGERADRVALVGVDVGREEQRQLAQRGELAGDERAKDALLLGEQRRAVDALQ